MYKVIASGSEANAVIYHNSIMVDCGVPFSALKDNLRSLKLVLTTHMHADHFRISTIKRLAKERPTLRFGACEWMIEHMEGIKNVDFYQIGKVYDYGLFKISPVKLYHDVENCGYRIFKDDTKIFHATDTKHLKGITAKGYDLYSIEHNYNEEVIRENIENDLSEGRYSYAIGAINSHLSEEQASDFIFKNKGPECEILRLHESKHNL